MGYGRFILRDESGATRPDTPKQQLQDLGSVGLDTGLGDVLREVVHVAGDTHNNEFSLAPSTDAPAAKYVVAQ